MDTIPDSDPGDETGPETLRERGQRIAEMVEAEATVAEAETETETDEDASGLPCPLCGGNIDLPDVPPQDSNKERCNTCNGFGMTVTGSLVPEMQIDQCSDCQGRGWVNKVPTYSLPVGVPPEHEQNPARVEVVNPELPPLILPDPASLRVS